MNVQDVTIESDENGFELHLLTDNGWEIFNIHGVVPKLELEVRQEITPYIDEAERYGPFRLHPETPNSEKGKTS